MKSVRILVPMTNNQNETISTHYRYIRLSMAYWPRFRQRQMGIASRDSENDAYEIVSTGLQSLGNIAGAAIALYSGTPLSQLVGAALAPIFTNTLLDVVRRSSSPRARLRLGATAGFAAYRISQRLLRGETLHPGIFQYVSPDRTIADELLDGCLSWASSEHEEIKTIFAGNLWASICFDPDISRARANHFIALTNELTYRQYVLIALMAGDKACLRARDYRGTNDDDIPLETWSILQEILALSGKGLCICGYPVPRGEAMAMLGIEDVQPNIMNLTNLGRDFYQLAGLENIPTLDLESPRAQLSD